MVMGNMALEACEGMHMDNVDHRREDEGEGEDEDEEVFDNFENN